MPESISIDLREKSSRMLSCRYIFPDLELWNLGRSAGGSSEVAQGRGGESPLLQEARGSIREPRHPCLQWGDLGSRHNLHRPQLTLCGVPQG